MVFETLKVKPLQRAASSWANAVVDAIEQVYWLGKRGDPDTPFCEFYGFYGYFFNNVFVQGKPVIKDGDPISIYDIFQPVQQKITQSIDNSLLTQYTSKISSITSNLTFDEAKNLMVALGKPVNVYDISDYVKTKISQSIDSTTTAQNVSVIAQYSQNLGKLITIEQYVRDTRDRVIQLKIDQYGNIGVIIAQPLDAYGRIPVTVEDAFKPVSVKGSISASDNMYGFGITLYTGGRPNVNIYYKMSGAGNIYVKVSNDGVSWRTLDVITLSGAGEDILIYTGLAFQYIRVETDATGIDVEFEVAASR